MAHVALDDGCDGRTRRGLVSAYGGADFFPLLVVDGHSNVLYTIIQLSLFSVKLGMGTYIHEDNRIVIDPFKMDA